MADAGRIEVIVNIDIMGLDQFDQVARAAQRMAGATDNATKQMQKSVGRFERLRQALDALEQKYDGVFRAGFRLQAAGRDLIDSGQAILGFLSEATDAWGDYEFMLNRAAGAMGLFDKMSPLYKTLRNDIETLAQEMRVFPADDVAKATYFWGSTTGQQIESIKDLKLVLQQLDPIMKTAALTETDYETAVKTAYNVTEQFNLGLGRSGEVIQKLLLLTQRTAAELPDLTNSMKFVGPVAAQIGADFDEVAVALGLVADEGIRGTIAGRALRQMFIQTLRPSARAKAALDDAWKSTKELGKSFDELIFPNGKYVGLEEHVRQLALATQDMTDKERGSFLAIISTANELPVLSALVQRQTEAMKKNKSAWDGAKYSLDNYGEAFDNMFELLRGSWKGVVGFLQNTWLTLVRRVGESVAEALTPWVEGLAKILQQVDIWMRANEPIVDMIVKVAGLIGVLLVVAGTFLLVMGSLILFGTGIVFAFQALGLILGIFGPLIAGFSVLAGIVVFVVQDIVRNFEQWREALRVLETGFGNFLEALGLGAGEFGSVWRTIAGEVANGASRMLGAVKDGIVALGQFFDALSRNEQAMSIIRTVVSWLIKLAAVGTGITVAGFSLRTIAGAAALLAAAAVGVGKFVYAISGLKAMVGVVRAFAGALTFLAANPIIAALILLAAVVAALYVAFDTNFMGIRDIIGNVVKAVGTFLSGFVSFVGEVAGNITGVVQGIAKPFIDIFQEKIPGAVRFVQRKFEEWGKTIGDAIDAVRPTIEAIGNTIRHVFEDKVIPTIRNVIDRIGPLVDAIVGFLGPAWTFLAWVVTTAMGIIGSVVMFVIDQIVAAWAFMVGTVIPILEPFFQLVIEMFGIAFELIGNIVSAAMRIIEGVIRVVTGIITLNWEEVWNGIAQIFRGAWDLVISILKAAGEVILNVISRALQLVWNVITSVIKNILGWIGDRVGDFVRIGGDWIKGLWDGITGFFGWLWNNVSGFFADIWSRILGFFGVKSPSTKFAELGVNLIKGLWDGLWGSINWLVTNISKFLREVWDFFTKLPGKALELGGDIVAGIWDGITGLAGWLYDQVSNFMEDIWNNVITFWDNHSPSRRMMRLGEQLMQGLAIGLVDEGRSAKDAMLTTMESLNQAGERATQLAGGQFTSNNQLSFATTEKKELAITVDVTSSDGSVTQENAETIGEAIHKGLLLDRLEHMAAVG